MEELFIPQIGTVGDISVGMIVVPKKKHITRWKVGRVESMNNKEIDVVDLDFPDNFYTENLSEVDILSSPEQSQFAIGHVVWEDGDGYAIAIKNGHGIYHLHPLCRQVMMV